MDALSDIIKDEYKQELNDKQKKSKEYKLATLEKSYDNAHQ